MSVTSVAPLHGILHPWKKPQPGASPSEVAPGVHWVRFPMPASLNHINLWLLEDIDGWTLVDTGLDLPDGRLLWRQLFESFLGGKPIKRIICTHLHPDHVGLAGWLCERSGAELLMTRQEFLMCRTLTSDTTRPAPQSALQFYRAAGYSERDIEDYKQRFGGFGKVISPLPERYRRLTDREILSIDGRQWQVVVGNGHSPEHACLYCPALNLLISGDQILPDITSNISVFPLEPHGDPLSDWLDSCARLRSILPADLLVLPSHGTPFYGVKVRLTQLIESHRNDLDSLWQHLDTPKRVVDCFPALFKRVIDPINLGLATGEALAHLNHLIGIQKATCTTDDMGVNWYSRLD